MTSWNKLLFLSALQWMLALCYAGFSYPRVIPTPPYMAPHFSASFAEVILVVVVAAAAAKVAVAATAAAAVVEVVVVVVVVIIVDLIHKAGVAATIVVVVGILSMYC
ncbi:hypothetical protein ElyMa_006277800 [Elysia marginata]|uniref:Uncharacterized protein n=1 Tax=Elysia marginata TaxID=1093978 RepID=A0AAV4HDT3_9GAST|nr:hypothetical protein ElyMa_006277800 [Elysia marginata]